MIGFLLAILFSGSILAAQSLTEMLVIPFAGVIVDRFGTKLRLTIAVMARIYQDSKTTALARNQKWHDIGAAARSRTTGAALTVILPELLHVGLTVVFSLAFRWFLKSSGWHILVCEHEKS